MNKQATPPQASEAPVWFITGCSTDFGYFAAVEEGDAAEVRKMF